MKPMRFRILPIQRRRRAAVLVLSLWIVLVLSVIASSLAFDVQVNSKLALLQRNQFLAYNLAKSAIGVGMTHLQNDRLIDHEENPNQQYDAFSDVWAQPERREKDLEVELGKNGTYELEISDEESKININVAGQKVLKALVEFYGFEPPDSDDIANAILDYRDQDDVATGATAEKENEHYSGLLGQKITRRTNPEELIYQCANEPFLVPEALMDVAGIDAELFYGYDPEAADAKEEQIRNAIAQGKHVAQRKASKRQKQLPLKDVITVRGNGRVNVNTASEEVLTILMYAGQNCQNLDGAQSTAESIVQFRGTAKKGRAPDPDDAFKSAADLQKVPGVNPQAISSMSGSGMGASIGFNSEIYAVKGIGRVYTGPKNNRVPSVQKTVTAIVQRKLDVYNPDDAQLASNAGSGSRPKRQFNTRRTSKGGKGEADNYIRIPAIRVVQWIE